MNHPVRSRRLRDRGVLLWEMMIALSLFATFALVSLQLARISLRVPQQAGEAASLANRLDGAVEQLRRDVWGAASVQAPEPGGKVIRIERGGDAPAIGWAISEDGALVRAATAAGNGAADPVEQQEWRDVARGMTFELDGPVLFLVEPPSAKRDGRRIPVVNPVQALRGRSS